MTEINVGAASPLEGLALEHESKRAGLSRDLLTVDLVDKPVHDSDAHDVLDREASLLQYRRARARG